MLLEAAVSRTDIGDYVSALFYVYIALLLLYILINLVLSFGMRPPYSRAFDVVMSFLRDVVEPYLRVFRRFIPALGGLDLSPLLAIILLYIVRALIVSAIDG